MNNSALLLSLGLCMEQSRGPGVWAWGPGRNDPLKSTEMVSEGSRVLAAPMGCQSCEHKLCPAQGMCVCPHSSSCRNCSHLYREAFHLSPQMDKNMREMHRTAAAWPGDSVQGCDGTVMGQCRARLPLPPCPSIGIILTFPAPPGPGNCLTTNKQCCTINWLHHRVTTVLRLQGKLSLRAK